MRAGTQREHGEGHLHMLMSTFAYSNPRSANEAPEPQQKDGKPFAYANEDICIFKSPPCGLPCDLIFIDMLIPC